MASGEVRVEEAVTPALLISIAILSVVLTVIWDFFIALLPQIAFCTQNVSNIIPTPGVELMGLPFVMFLFIIALRRIKPLSTHLDTTKIVYLYSATLGISYFANTTYPWHDAGMTAMSSLVTPESYLKYVPEFVVPPREVADILLTGTKNISTIPWDKLFPVMIWEFLLVALFGAVSVGFVSIIRRQWIDVERLPFPQVRAAYACLESIRTQRWSTKKPFLYGVVAGVMLAIPLSAGTLFPWFPDILGWRTNTCGPGSQWIAPAEIPWHLGIAKHAPLYALLLLTPLHTLISVLIYTLVMEVAVFVSFYAFGAYTGMTQLGFCGRNWCSPTPYTEPPLFLSSVNIGAMFGLFFATIVLQRNYFLDTLKAAFGKLKDREFESGEPISYRASWSILIVFYTIMMVFFMFTGFSPWMSFVLPLSGIMTWFVMAQLWGRIGFMVEPCYDFTPGIIRLFAYPTQFRPDVISTDLALAPTLSREWIGHQSISGWGGSFYTSLASYEMARLTDVNPRNILKVMLVAMFTAMFVTHFAQFLIPGLFGWSRLNYGNIPSDLESHALGNFWNRPSNAPISELGTHITIGFVFMVIARWAYSRFLWVPDPITAIVAWSWVISLHGTWIVCLVAYVVKSIVLKVGGSKLYEQWVVPFVGGFILGDALEVLLAAITSYALLPPAL